MRYRRLIIALIFLAAAVCCLSLAYFSYGRQQVAALAAACRAAREARQWDELETLATAWIAWDQRAATAWLYAAEAASEQGQDVRSAAYLYFLPDDDPRTPAALLELSHLQFGTLNQPEAAAQTCERILRLQPNASEAHRRLIFFFAMSRQRSRIIEEARRAIQHGCDTPETFLYLLGADWITFTNGEELNQRWLQSAPESETFLVAAAFHRVRSRALDESTEERNPDGTSNSEKLMRDLLSVYPHNTELLAFHLDLATFRGNERRATELLSQAPPESIRDSRFWRYKGWVHEARQEFEDAEQAYLKAIELHPFDGQSHHELAAIYRRKQDSGLVEKHQSLAVLGKEIMRDCLQSPNSQSLASELLSKMARYAEQSGDSAVASRLRERISLK